VACVTHFKDRAPSAKLFTSPMPKLAKFRAVRGRSIRVREAEHPLSHRQPRRWNLVQMVRSSGCKLQWLRLRRTIQQAGPLTSPIGFASRDPLPSRSTARWFTTIVGRQLDGTSQMSPQPCSRQAGLGHQRSRLVTARFHRIFTNLPSHLIHNERGVSHVLIRGVPLTRSSGGQNRP
jgi:hypothetical protein